MHTIVHTFINALAINTSNYFEQSLEHPGHQEEAARGARFVQVILSCNIVFKLEFYSLFSFAAYYITHMEQQR